MAVLAFARNERDPEDAPRDVTGELFARFEALERVFAEQTEVLREQSAQLAAHEADLLTRETALRSELERLEQEQLIWGEAARESRAALDARAEELSRREADLLEREERLASAEADLDRRVADVLSALGAVAPTNRT